MKTLVAGGAGFIGSHIVDRLLADGHTVTVIDNFSTGRPENLAHHKGQRQLAVVQADITDAELILPHLKGVDWVFHVAALADIVPSMERPMDYFRANVHGTVQLLEAARHGGVKRFIYTASSSCYGIPDIYPTPEDSPIRPQYPYALTKYLAEQCVLHWGQVYRLPVISLRLFNVYGPRSRTSGTYGAVFGVFLAQKLKGRPFTVVGDGTQVRDFTFVTDTVEAFMKAAKSDSCNEVFNVGSGNPSSVNRLVELLQGKVVYIPKRPGEPDQTHADCAKIAEALGWRAAVSFEEGVREMIRNIDYWKNAPVWTPESIEDATKDWFRYLSPTSDAGRQR